MTHISRKPLFWAVTLGHLVNDIFMSMGTVLLAFLSTTVLPMSAAQIGVMISARQIVGAASQPLFGYYGDRTGGRWFGFGGVAWTTVFLLLSMGLAFTGQFWLMALPFALSALGSGAFHPVGAMYAAEAEREYESTNISMFFLAGQVGLALGPALAGLLLDSASRAAEAGAPTTISAMLPIFLLGAIALPTVSFMAHAMPRARARATPKAGSGAAARAALRALAGPLLLMALFVLLRSVAQLGSSSFIPVLFERKGWSPAEYGFITSAYWIASAVVGVWFGGLAERYNALGIIAISLVAGAVALYLLPTADGALAYVLAVGSGALLGGSHSLIVVIAQYVIPAGRALASGLILGYVFVAGAIGTTFFGVLADGPSSLTDAQVIDGGIGLGATFQVAAGIAAISALLVVLLPAWVGDKTLRASSPPTPAPKPEESPTPVTGD
jgi:FSR family fosmidomycin resistance protein-like MFS transporter